MSDSSFEGLKDEWDNRYAASPRLFRAEPDESLVGFVTPLPAGTAVDLGAGEGRNSLWLASRGWEVTAIDASAVALGRLAAAAEEVGLSVRTVVDDLVGSRPTSPEADLVVLAYVHLEPAGRAELLATAAASLGAGGYLFVVGHHLSSLGVVGPPDPRRLYTEDDLRAVPGIDVISLQLRHGDSDVTTPGTDVVLWGCRRREVTPAS